LQSLNRVLELPVVISAWQLALERYDQLKHYSPLVESSLAKAEQIGQSTVQRAAEVSKPIVKKLERPLSFADSLVCQGLDKFEEYVPVIKKSPEEIKTAGWDKYEEVKDYGNQKVTSIKAYGYDHVNQALHNEYVLTAMKYVDAAIDVTDQMVDKYLPPTKEGEEEQKEKPGQDADVVRRLSFVTGKVRHRAYDQAVHTARAAINRLQETTGSVLSRADNSNQSATDSSRPNQDEVLKISGHGRQRRHSGHREQHQES